VRVNIGAVRAVALGEYHTCALQNDGLVACWGRNMRGEIGRVEPRLSSEPLSVPGLGQALGVVAGRRHACALLDGGRLSCWGANYSGQLGRPVSDGAEPPGDVPWLAAGASGLCRRG
jgi:alpha-tubulin suppressor-like RCC1 family protein